jgi:hypothetical protein
MVYVLTMTSPKFLDSADLWRLFEKACPETVIQRLCREQRLVRRRGVYSVLVVLWLMVLQRLNGKRTCGSAVQWLMGNAEALHGRSACKRVRESRISPNTGGYCQARQKLPTVLTSRVVDTMFEELQRQMREVMPDLPYRLYIPDGTTLRAPWGKQLVERFPPGGNQHGENHWPTLLLVTFHDAYTGLAIHPSWGAMYGAEAVSEQHLAQQALARLPEDAVVMGDGNFGIFAFAYAVQQSNRRSLLRLTVARVKKVLEGASLRPGRRRRVVWKPSEYERRMHPELGHHSALQGWVVACRNPAKPVEMLYFFTTLDLKPSRILALYKLRWNIETDLRSLKRTVGLHQLSGRTPDMVEKELLAAVASYNLVRAIIYRAARQAALRPREFSFSAAQDAVLAAWSELTRATSDQERERVLLQLVQAVGRLKLPHRARKRSYPRRVWGRGARFPNHRSTPLREVQS